MNKADLIDAIAKKAEMTKKDAGVALMQSLRALRVFSKRRKGYIGWLWYIRC